MRPDPPLDITWLATLSPVALASSSWLPGNPALEHRIGAGALEHRFKLRPTHLTPGAPTRKHVAPRAPTARPSVAIAHYFAARAPAAMITKIAKPIIAHQAMLSVSLCHLRTSHMTQTPFSRDCWS